MTQRSPRHNHSGWGRRVGVTPHPHPESSSGVAVGGVASASVDESVRPSEPVSGSGASALHVPCVPKTARPSRTWRARSSRSPTRTAGLSMCGRRAKRLVESGDHSDGEFVGTVCSALRIRCADSGGRDHQVCGGGGPVSAPRGCPPRSFSQSLRGRPPVVGERPGPQHDRTYMGPRHAEFLSSRR